MKGIWWWGSFWRNARPGKRDGMPESGGMHYYFLVIYSKNTMLDIAVNGNISNEV